MHRELNAWEIIGIFAAIMLGFWAVIGISSGVTYGRNQESACAAVGGQLRAFGGSYDACWKIHYEQIPFEDVRTR